MLFSTTTNKLPAHIIINDVPIEKVDCIKFLGLGLYIDCKLTWAKHGYVQTAF